MAASCPCCNGTGAAELPVGDDVAEYPCPICRPWPLGFGGLRAYGEWVIPPYGPGDVPSWHGFAAARAEADRRRVARMAS